MANQSAPPTPPDGKRGAKDTGQDVGQDEVRHALTEEQERGYRGFKVDPTPDEHYTIGGVIDGKPTPETDADAAAEAFHATTGRFR